MTSMGEIRLQHPLPRPIRIRILMTMKGPVYAVRCRACNHIFAYWSTLDLAFASADRHINQHVEQIRGETWIEFVEQTC